MVGRGRRLARGRNERFAATSSTVDVASGNCDALERTLPVWAKCDDLRRRLCTSARHGRCVLEHESEATKDDECGAESRQLEGGHVMVSAEHQTQNERVISTFARHMFLCSTRCDCMALLSSVHNA